MLRRRAREVDLDLVAGDRDRGANLQRSLEWLEDVDRLVAAVRQLGQRRPHDALRVAEELVHRGRDRLLAAPLDQLLETPLCEPVRRDLRAQVAPALVRVAHVREQEREHLLAEPDGRHDHPLLVELARLGRQAGGLHPADVRVVRARDGEAARHARDDRDVRQVRAARVRVVEDVELPRLRILGANGRDRLGHGPEVHRDVLGLGDHASLRVEERGRAVAPLLDVGREGRPDEHGAHLLRRGPQTGSDHLQLNFHAFVTPSSVGACYLVLVRWSRPEPPPTRGRSSRWHRPVRAGPARTGPSRAG